MLHYLNVLKTCHMKKFDATVAMAKTQIEHNHMKWVIHSLIPVISTAPLQVHYYSEVLPTQHGYCVGISCRSATGNCEWRTCQGPYVADRARFEPATFWTKALDLPLSHYAPLVSNAYYFVIINATLFPSFRSLKTALFALGLSNWKPFWLVSTARSAI